MPATVTRAVPWLRREVNVVVEWGGQGHTPHFVRVRPTNAFETGTFARVGIRAVTADGLAT